MEPSIIHPVGLRKRRVPLLLGLQRAKGSSIMACPLIIIVVIIMIIVIVAIILVLVIIINRNNINKKNSSSNNKNNDNPYLTWKYLICWDANPAVLLSLCESDQCKFNVCPTYGKRLESLCKTKGGRLWRNIV